MTTFDLWKKRILASVVDHLIVAAIAAAILFPLGRGLRFDQLFFNSFAATVTAATYDLRGECVYMEDGTNSCDPPPGAEQAFRDFEHALFLILGVALLTVHAYFILFERFAGRTPGKRLLKLQILGTKGRPSLLQTIRRELARHYLDSLAVTLLLSLLTDSSRRSLGDRLSQTRVISD